MSAVVVPASEAVRLLYHLVAALGVLSDDDRQAVLILLAEEAAELPSIA